MKPEERILQSSVDLFMKYGIKSITMDDIAKQLGISKKTIYHYYKDKNQLVTKFVEQALQCHMSQFEQIASSAKDPIDEMIQIAKYMSNIFTQMNPSLFHDMQKFHFKAWLNFKNFKREHAEGMIVRNLMDGVKKGLYRKDINITILAKLRMEEIDLGLNAEVYPHDAFNIADVQMSLLDNFIHGITTIKGHKLINKYKEVIEDE